MRVRPDAVVARHPLADRDDSAPLREPRAELVVLLEALAEAVEAFGDGFALGSGKRLRALVDLDPRDDPAALEQLRERRPVRGALADRLVEQDHAADEFFDAFGREEQVAVTAPVLLGGFDADRVESLLDRAVALVRRQDSLAGRDERLRDLLQRLCLGHGRHLGPPLVASPRLCPVARFSTSRSHGAESGHRSGTTAGLVRLRR